MYILVIEWVLGRTSIGGTAIQQTNITHTSTSYIPNITLVIE